jgi:hypothetical protein
MGAQPMSVRAMTTNMRVVIVVFLPGGLGVRKLRSARFAVAFRWFRPEHPASTSSNRKVRRVQKRPTERRSKGLSRPEPPLSHSKMHRNVEQMLNDNSVHFRRLSEGGRSMRAGYTPAATPEANGSLSWDFPDDPRPGIDNRTFSAFCEGRRGAQTASDASGGPKSGWWR